MTDVHDKKTRSYNMSQIRHKGTKPELIVQKFLHSKRLRFKLHDEKLPGTPDIVLSNYRFVIQIHGCFWHRHKGCKFFVIPKTRTEWWLQKITKTVQRDKKNKKKLKELGWTTIIIWECELRGDKKDNTLNKLYEKIKCQK